MGDAERLADAERHLVSTSTPDLGSTDVRRLSHVASDASGGAPRASFGLCHSLVISISEQKLEPSNPPM